MSKNTHLPFFIDVKGKKVRIYGGGKIARRRIHTMLDFEADVTVVAPDVLEEIAALPSLTLEYRTFEPGEIKNKENGLPDIILAATNDRSVNAMIYEESRQAGIWANNASDKSQCDFLFPAVIRSGDMVVGVTSGGRDHEGTARFAKKIRRLAKGQEGE